MFCTFNVFIYKAILTVLRENSLKNTKFTVLKTKNWVWKTIWTYSKPRIPDRETLNPGFSGSSMNVNYQIQNPGILC